MHPSKFGISSKSESVESVMATPDPVKTFIDRMENFLLQLYVNLPADHPISIAIRDPVSEIIVTGNSKLSLPINDLLRPASEGGYHPLAGACDIHVISDVLVPPITLAAYTAGGNGYGIGRGYIHCDTNTPTKKRDAITTWDYETSYSDKASIDRVASRYSSCINTLAALQEAYRLNGNNTAMKPILTALESYRTDLRLSNPSTRINNLYSNY